MEKFGIPRQPGIIKSTFQEIVFFNEFSLNEAFRGIEEYSHLWIIFIFTEIKRNDWKPTVRPPRAGGNKRMGVFATRSPYRPNPIGLSAVRNEGLKKTEDGNTVLLVSGGDFMDGTTVIDIKPYIPYSDSINEAFGGFASDAPKPNLKVKFSLEAERKAEKIIWNGNGSFKDFIEDILSQDPRPAYHSTKKTKKEYAFKLSAHDVIWEVEDDTITVKDIIPLNAKEL